MHIFSPNARERAGHHPHVRGESVNARFSLLSDNTMSKSTSTSLPSAQSGSWSSFLKSIALFSGDLLTLTAPPFILSPTLLVEFSKYWGEHPNLLVDAVSLADTPDASAVERDAMALKRMLSVTRWFISTLRSQYCSRNEKMGTEKKPLNPFLGEVFVGKWDDPKGSVGETVLVSEQVSHHPPVTAYAILNEKHKTKLEGYNGVVATISATSINIKQYGHAILLYEGLDEQYLCTLPPLHIEGLISASPFVELEGTLYIQASNGYIAVIDYSGRGYFSGKKHEFKARIFRDHVSTAHKENAVVTISGQWLGKLFICKGLSTPKEKHGDELFYDAMATKPQHLLVKPIAEQNPLESRRAWQTVTEAIKKGDYQEIHNTKSVIENEQREMRKQELEEGIKWEPRWFDLVDYADVKHDPFLNMTNLLNLSIKNCPSGTAKGSKYDEGDSKHWRFDESKWANEREITIGEHPTDQESV